MLRWGITGKAHAEHGSALPKRCHAALPDAR
jgi:hypothetical protein